MRLIISLLFFVAVAGLAAFGFIVISDPAKTYDLFANLSGNRSLEKESLVAFVPPKGNFRAWFPGAKPDELTEYNSFLRQTPLPSPQYYSADKDVGYFAAAWPADFSSVASINVQRAPQTYSQYGFVIPQTGPPVPAQINVNLTQQEAMMADPIEIQKLLDKEAEGLVSKHGGTISNKVPIAGGGGAFPGRSVEGKFKNTNNNFRMRLFLDQRNKRWFCVCVVGKTKRAYSAQSTKFLNTFDIWS
jgi:hypothetical protein